MKHSRIYNQKGFRPNNNGNELELMGYLDTPSQVNSSGITNSGLVLEKRKVVLRQWFRQHVSNLFSSREMTSNELLTENKIMNKIDIKFHVFYFGVKNEICTQMNCTQVITSQDSEIIIRCIFKSVNRKWSQTISVVTKARQWYSALLLEREMIIFFLDPQDMRLPPKKTHKPDVNFWSSRSEAKSASTNTYMEISLGFVKSTPWSIGPLLIS